MCLCLLRRSVLRSMIVAPVLAACEAVPRADPVLVPSDAISGRWLDVHCHVFNARDVPLYEFVKRTRLHGVEGIAAPLLAMVAGGLRYQAATAEDELYRLRAGGAPIFRAAPPGGAVARTRVGRVDAFRGLERLRERGLDRDLRPGARARARAPADDGASNVAPSGNEALDLFDRAFRETGIRTGRLATRSGLPAPPTDNELRSFEALITGRTRRRGGGVLGRYFAWGLMFTEDRDALTSRLAALYPGAELMMTPAMVDYDHWLAAPDNGPGGQVQVMEAIAVRRARAGTPVHAFLAFDPWRCLQARSEGRDTLAHLKAALASGAGIGVKLYPPMGFSAANNVQRPAEDFPRALQRLTGGRPGAALDDVMDELLDHLADNGIPVMTHCGETNASEPRYAALAGPTFWEAALKRDGRSPRRRELRLNLGHFGGIWELGAADESQRVWAREATVLMTRYPNVFADIGYFGSVLEDDPGVVAQTGVFLAELAAMSGSRLRERLMYGSDWSMIGQEDRPERYPTAAVTALAGTWDGPRGEDLKWRNAATFLGLGAREATRGRLAGLYRRNSVDFAALARFDPAT